MKKLRSWLKLRRSVSLTLREIVPRLLVLTSRASGRWSKDRKKIELVEFIKYCQAIDADPHEGLEIIIQSIS